MTHLAFYREHSISPVNYSGTKEQHFQRRASLYRSLRLPPLAFRGSRVLEVAAGTGQNAEYLASLNPLHLELVEPYPAKWSSQSAVKITTLEHYQPPFPFDIVICENWLGLEEQPLIDKLASMVAPQGVLVLTCVHPEGFYPNQLRRKIAQRLINESMSFESKTEILVNAFEPHLKTLTDMTRSPRDWVQDQLLNPAVENIVLTFPMLIERLGKDFTILGTSPEFITDWRWYKRLHGENKLFNERAMLYYHLGAEQFKNCMSNRPVTTADGIAEAEALLCKKSINVEDVRSMRSFSRLFGRETIFTSWTRDAR